MTINCLMMPEHTCSHPASACHLYVVVLICVLCVPQVLTSDRPCHMYFDVEFSKAANPGQDGPGLVARLVELVKRLFRHVHLRTCALPGHLRCRACSTGTDPLLCHTRLS